MIKIVSPALIAANALTDLSDRVELLDGPSAELDMLIDCAFRGVEVSYPKKDAFKNGRGRVESDDDERPLLGWVTPTGEFTPKGKYPPVTASIDASNELMPENVVIAVTISDGPVSCAVTLNEIEKYVAATGKTEALARTSAALLAHAAIIIAEGD